MATALTLTGGLSGKPQISALVFNGSTSSETVDWFCSKGLDVATVQAIISATTTVTVYQYNGAAAPADGTTTGATTYPSTLTASGSLTIVAPADWTGIAATVSSGSVTVYLRGI